VNCCLPNLEYAAVEVALNTKSSVKITDIIPISNNTNKTSGNVNPLLFLISIPPNCFAYTPIK
ncbi:MAG TPA: hypothetical protein VIL05_03425, partial [Thermoclostridium sp.]